MNARQLIVLAGIAIVSVVATAVVMRTTATAVPSDHRGEPVLAALRTRSGEFTGLTVRDGTNSIAIERRGNEFVATDSGFPVRLETLRDVVASSAELAFNEARTADPSRYGDLGLADTGDSAGKEIVFHAGSGDIADIIVGNRDTTAAVGTAGGGQFIRIKGQPQTWLVRGAVRLPTSRNSWYSTVDFDIKRDEIQKIELAGGGRDAVTAIKNPDAHGEFNLENVPEKRLPEEFKTSRLATLFDAFSFQDVRRSSGPAPADARHITVDADGVRLTLTSVGEPSDGWVQIHAEATNDGKSDKASAIAAKTANFDFRLPSQESEVLTWTVADVTTEKPAEAEPKPGDADVKGGDAGLKHDDGDLKPDGGAPKQGDGDPKP